MVNRIITCLFSAKTRAAALERTIDRLSAKASARYARGNIAGQDGHINAEFIREQAKRGRDLLLVILGIALGVAAVVLGILASRGVDLDGVPFEAVVAVYEEVVVIKVVTTFSI